MTTTPAPAPDGASPIEFRKDGTVRLNVSPKPIVLQRPKVKTFRKLRDAMTAMNDEIADAGYRRRDARAELPGTNPEDLLAEVGRSSIQLADIITRLHNGGHVEDDAAITLTHEAQALMEKLVAPVGQLSEVGDEDREAVRARERALREITQTWDNEVHEARADLWRAIVSMLGGDVSLPEDLDEWEEWLIGSPKPLDDVFAHFRSQPFPSGG